MIDSNMLALDCWNTAGAGDGTYVRTCTCTEPDGKKNIYKAVAKGIWL